MTERDDLPPGYKQTEVGVIPEDWEVHTLGQMTVLLTNGFVGKVKDFYTDSDDSVLYVQGYNVQPNCFNYQGICRVSRVFHEAHKKSCLKEGDLLTIQTGDVGVTALVSSELIGANCHALIISRLKKQYYEPSYYCQYFNSERGRVAFKEIETGTTMKHLNVGDMIDLSLPFPPFPEQHAIAAALSDVDGLIGALDALIAKKRDMKQAAMQQLLTGRTRLPGFEGKWEEKKIGALLKVHHGRSQREIAHFDGKYPILASGGEIGRTDIALFSKPSVLIGRKGTIDDPQYISSPFWTVDTLFYTEINEKNVAKFVFYKFCMIPWRNYNEASGVPSLNAKTIENIEIVIPGHDEQTAIATVLSDMDAEIAALERRRNKAKEIKQGMMQQLLTGKVRLVSPEGSGDRHCGAEA